MKSTKAKFFLLLFLSPVFFCHAARIAFFCPHCQHRCKSDTEKKIHEANCPMRKIKKTPQQQPYQLEKLITVKDAVELMNAGKTVDNLQRFFLQLEKLNPAEYLHFKYMLELYEKKKQLIPSKYDVRFSIQRRSTTQLGILPNLQNPHQKE